MTKITIVTESAVVLSIDGQEFNLGREVAIGLAVELVREADGSLIQRVEDGRVVEWNTNSPFHRLYKKIWEDKQ